MSAVQGAVKCWLYSCFQFFHTLNVISLSLNWITGFPRSWKNLEKTFLGSHGKMMENLLKIESHEILLRAEKKFF